MTYKEYKMRKYYLDQIPDLNDVMTKIWDKFNLFHKLLVKALYLKNLSKLTKRFNFIYNNFHRLFKSQFLLL